MKLIIAGGRDYHFTSDDYARLEELHAKRPITEVVHGGASGADFYGACWATSRRIYVHPPFVAEWSDLSHSDARIRTRRDGRKYDAEAGPRRNRAMAAYADAVALFPGGGGTQSMYNAAKEAGIEIFDFRAAVGDEGKGEE